MFKKGSLYLFLLRERNRRRLFYIATCVALRPSSLGSSLLLVRRRDRSFIRLHSASPNLLGFKLLRSPS
jgi:hypothetical protein